MKLHQKPVCRDQVPENTSFENTSSRNQSLEGPQILDLTKIDSVVRDVAPFDVESGIFMSRDSYFYRLANILGTVISSLIPIVAIIVLHVVSNMAARLGIVCGFTAIFSVSLASVTQARRIEIFAATAA